jgi:hypothetical protein
VRLPISTFQYLNAVLARAVELGASDIHLKVAQPPIVRRDAQLSLLPEHPPLTEADLEAALAVIADLTPAKLRPSTRPASSTSPTRPATCRASGSTASVSAARSPSPSG